MKTRTVHFKFMVTLTTIYLYQMLLTLFSSTREVHYESRE